MKLLKFLLVLIPLLSINLSKKKKKKKQNDQKENPLDKRPNGTTPELFCDACIAIIKESTKLLYNKKKESDVIEVLEDICNPQLYYTYNHPPPEMKEGCNAFISSWSDELENALINRIDDETPIQKLCYEVSEACKNVDPKEGRKSDNHITIDGEPQELNLGELNKKNEAEQRQDL